MREELLITCEHACGEVPEGMDLGLSIAMLASHVSFDRGALAIADRLAALTGAPCHRGRFSRLVVDLNRREENADVIAEVTYGVEVPGNRGLDPEAREARIARWHRPYRRAARDDAMRIAARAHCVHLSIHAFDPTLAPEARTVFRSGGDAGVLFDTERAPEREIAARIASLLGDAGWDTRHNEPYAGVPEGLTSWLRAQIVEERYTGIEIEANRRWVDRSEAVEAFARVLASSLAE